MAEFKLIEQVVKQLGGSGDQCGVALDSGDDAAQLVGGSWPLVTTDTLVEGTHWDPDYSSLTDVGFKLLSVNLSDIAAMGGEAGPMLLSFTLPSPLQKEHMMALTEGISLCRSAHGLSESKNVAIGGDLTTSSGLTVLTMTLFGRIADSGRVVRRKGGRAGDDLWVSGTLGSAAAGLAALQAGLKSNGDFSALISQHLRPTAQLRLGGLLSQIENVHALIDLSDGLAGDLPHLVEGTGLGAEVFTDKLPCRPALNELARRLQRNPLDWMLSGGEDFQLLCAASPCCGDLLGEMGMTKIGHLNADGEIRYLDAENRRIHRKFSGYEHR